MAQYTPTLGSYWTRTPKVRSRPAYGAQTERKWAPKHRFMRLCISQ